MKVNSSAFKHMGLAAGCPEGSRLVGNQCECYPGRVWMTDGSRCVSPQAPAFSGALTWQESMMGHTPDTYGQQELSDAAEDYIENTGHTVDCKISEDWFSGPQGGQPARVCSIDNGPFIHAAYLINLNPYNALVDIGAERSAVATLANQFGGAKATGGSGSSAGSGQGASQEGSGSAGGSEEPSGGDQDGETLLDALSGEWIEGIPNWALVAAVGVGGYVLTRR